MERGNLAQQSPGRCAREGRGDRVIVLLSSSNLAGTQAVIGLLNQRCSAGDLAPSLWSARTMFDVAMLVADAMREEGMPIALLCYDRDSLELSKRRRFDNRDAYFSALSHEWSEGTRQVFRRLPDLLW